MNRTEILAHLHKLEVAFKPMRPDRMALYADVIEKNNLSERELRDGVIACIETLEYFPAIAQILARARPVCTGQPPSTEQDSKDAIILHEDEIAVQTAWMRKFEAKGDDYGVRVARSAIERAQDAVNRRLLARGLGSRYVAVGVEQFGADEQPRAFRQSEHWTTEPEND